MINLSNIGGGEGERERKFQSACFLACSLTKVEGRGGGKNA